MFKKYAVIVLSLAAGLPAFGAPSKEKQLLKDVKNRAVSQRAWYTQVVLERDATVADLLTSTLRGHTGFNVPTMPETVDKFFMRSAPMSMKSYNIYQKLACDVEITSAGLLRFIKNVHLLFFDKSTGRLSPQGHDCQFAVQEVLKAHRVWYAKKTTFALTDLNAKEDVVFKFLQLLPLNDPKVKMLTENLISTSDKDISRRLLARTTVSARGNDSRAVKAYPKGWFRGVGESLLKNAAFGIVAWKLAQKVRPVARGLYPPNTTILGFLLNDPVGNLGVYRPGQGTQGSGGEGEDLEKNLCVAAGVGTFLAYTIKDLYDWKTDYNLTPEPNGGVDLRIKFKEVAPVDLKSKK